MPRYDASTAAIWVYTFKEGLLSAMAHDLKLEATRFTLEREGNQVWATVFADGLKVVTTRRDGRDDAGLLPRAVYPEIDKNTRDDVLEAKKFPQLRFESTRVSDAEIVGQLTLHGVTREVRCRRADDATHHVAEATLDVRDFGIKPFRAMLGALKVQPRVQVVVRLPKGESP